jgi:hypothetical protein
MDELKKAPGKQDLQAVAITPDITGRPSDEDPVPRKCTKMTPIDLGFLDKVRFADLEVLVRVGLIKEKDLVKAAFDLIGFDSGMPAPDDPCGNFWCIKMGGILDGLHNKVTPADLAVLVRLGIVNESALTKAQQADLKPIRTK